MSHRGSMGDIMSKRFVAVVGICLGVLVTLLWQQVGQTAPALTALDYIEIEQLYARYAAGADAIPDDGEMFAGTFTEDGVFEASPFFDGGEPFLLEGRDNLRHWADETRTVRRRGWRSPTKPLHNESPH